MQVLFKELSFDTMLMAWVGATLSCVFRFDKHASSHDRVREHHLRDRAARVAEFEAEGFVDCATMSDDDIGDMIGPTRSVGEFREFLRIFLQQPDCKIIEKAGLPVDVMKHDVEVEMRQAHELMGELDINEAPPALYERVVKSA